MKTSYLGYAKLAIEFTHTKVFSTSMLFDVSHNEVIKHAFKSIVFPLFLALDLIGSLIELISFIKQDNKNLGHSSRLILSIATTILTLLAVVFFASAYSAIAIGTCFVISVAIGAIFNTSMFVYHLYKRLNSSLVKKNTHLQEVYTANSLKYGISALTSLIVVSSLVLGVFFFPYLASGILFAVGVISAVVILGGGIYKIVNHLKNPISNAKQAIVQTNSMEPSPLADSDNQAISVMSNVNLQSEKNTSHFEYYAKEHRCHRLTEDLDKNRKFLLNEIFAKINVLEKEIEHDKGKLGELVWRQEEKRIEKIDLLINLAIFLLPIDELQAKNSIAAIPHKISLSEPLQEKLFLVYHQLNANLTIRNPSMHWKTDEDFFAFLGNFKANKAFQSFFKNTSDVNDIFAAVEYHFELEKLVKLEKAHTSIQAEKEKIQASLKEKSQVIIRGAETIDTVIPYVYSEKFSEEHF